MSVKILITALGLELISDLKMVQEKVDVNGEEKLIDRAYWLTNARAVVYSTNEDGAVVANFRRYCELATDASFELPLGHVVSILEPNEVALQAYEKEIASVEVSATEEEEVTEAPVEVVGE